MLEQSREEGGKVIGNHLKKKDKEEEMKKEKRKIRKEEKVKYNRIWIKENKRR